MDGQRTLSDVMAQLHACLDDLDRLGAVLAAAHLSACLDALAGDEQEAAFSSDTE
ncbi:MAG: hypothetical protein KGM17_01965 [Sphingomonadales bacterium]|nr:hypothetical protein [Sphingomonadales bacterium]